MLYCSTTHKESLAQFAMLKSELSKQLFGLHAHACRGVNKGKLYSISYSNVSPIIYMSLEKSLLPFHKV